MKHTKDVFGVGATTKLINRFVVHPKTLFFFYFSIRAFFLLNRPIHNTIHPERYESSPLRLIEIGVCLVSIHYTLVCVCVCAFTFGRQRTGKVFDTCLYFFTLPHTHNVFHAA